jgi:ABC-type multidrug transport system ATPase subunit
MKTCSVCQTDNAEASNFCKQCGRPLVRRPGDPQTDADTGAATGDKTVFWHGQKVAGQVTPHRKVSVAMLFRHKDRLVIGRAPDCDVCLPHPMVSRYHALIEKAQEGLRLRDLASINGVWVGGHRLTEPVLLQEGHRVGIGPFLFSLNQGVIHTVDNSRSLRLEARRLEKIVALAEGGTRKLLDDINLVVEPGEFVSLLGPSGSGKSTLMDCLNGRRRATGGQVLANGEDFYRHFDNFRQSLGYVPQKDIVHTQLTVYRALYYTARLRLPTDTDPAELQARIEEVLREMELVPHRDTLVANLSGGQIKRVSLGAELLAEPCMLYIDEATSGLDAGTETRMMRLFRGLSDQGRSIVCITHNLDNMDQCHLILVLARGKLMYFGPPGEAPGYFQVARISAIYDRLAEKDPDAWEKEFRAASLYKEYVEKRLAAPPQAEVPLPREDPRAPPAVDPEGHEVIARSKWPMLADRFRDLTARYLRVREWFSPVIDLWHQFRVLTARYVELVLGDRRSFRLLLLQAPIVAVFLLAGFIKKPFDETISPLDMFVNKDGEPTKETVDLLKKFQVTSKIEGLPGTLDGVQLVLLFRQIEKKYPDLAAMPENGPIEVTLDGKPVKLNCSDWEQLRAAFMRKNPRYTYMLLFMLVVVVLWFGCNNAAKEIVKEEAIYNRERAVNLGIVPYLASKFLVLSVITMIHAALMMVVVFGALGLLKLTLDGCSVPPPEQRLGYLSMFGVLVLLSMNGVALGLLLSACVSSPDRANALLPYVLIPQLILGGGFLKVTDGPLKWLAMVLSPVYWAYRAVHLGANQLPVSFPGHVDYEDDLMLPCAILVGQTVLLLLATAYFLRRKEG